MKLPAGGIIWSAKWFEGFPCGGCFTLLGRDQPESKVGQRGAVVRALLMVSDVSCSGEDGIVPDTGFDGKRSSEPLTDVDSGVGKNWPEDNRRDSSSVDASGLGGASELDTQATSLTDADGELGSSLDRLCEGGEHPSEASPTTARKAGPGEFELLKVIGMGAFGKVLQASSTLDYVYVRI